MSNSNSSRSTFRKGTPITTNDRRFVSALKRSLAAVQAEAPYITLGLISETLGFHKDYLGRIVNLTERPSREVAVTLASSLGFTEGQMRYHTRYFNQLPPATKRVATRMAEVSNALNIGVSNS